MANKDDQDSSAQMEAVMTQPLAAVDVADLRRMYGFIREASTVSAHPGGIGFDASVIAEQCPPGVDAMAVFWRASLLVGLVQGKMLERWRDAQGLQDVVLETMARHGLPQGLSNFDPEAFLAELERGA